MTKLNDYGQMKYFFEQFAKHPVQMGAMSDSFSDISGFWLGCLAAMDHFEGGINGFYFKGFRLFVKRQHKTYPTNIDWAAWLCQHLKYDENLMREEILSLILGYISDLENSNAEPL
jgi:hypothetical protein